MSVITGFAKTPDRVKMLHRERDNFSELLETSVERRGEKYKRSDRTPSKKTLDEDTATSIGKGMYYTRRCEWLTLVANIKLSQFLYHMANEPSIGLFHVNEHAKRSIPKIVSIKVDRTPHLQLTHTEHTQTQRRIHRTTLLRHGRYSSSHTRIQPH